MRFARSSSARCAAAAAAMALTLLPAAGRAGTVDLPLQIGGAYAVPATSWKEARFATTVRQQYDFSCGSAAVATLLSHHYGHTVSEQAVFDAMLQRGDRAKIAREGFSLLDMKRYLQAEGFEADGFEAPLTSLAEARVPAIALIQEAGVAHFVVVKGLRDGRVLLGDPASGTRAMPRDAFEAVRLNAILFVVGNRLDEARFNVASDWQAAPAAPLGHAAVGAASLALPKLGASDF